MDDTLAYLIEVLISLALPGLICGFLTIILSFTFCICVNCPLNCCTKAGYIACGESCEGGPPRFGYTKSCKYATAIVLFVSWIVLIIACALSFTSETHDAIETFMDLTVKAVKAASVAFQSSNAVVQQANTQNLYGIGETITNLAAALKETSQEIDKYSEYVYKGNDIRSGVITAGVSLVLVAFLFWLAGLATKMRVLNRTFAVFSVFGCIFAWFAFGVQMPMTVFVDVSCAVYGDVVDNITNIDLIDGHDTAAVSKAQDSYSDLSAHIDIGMPAAAEQVVISCVETDSYLSIFAASINATQVTINVANQLIDTESLPVNKFVKSIALPPDGQLYPPTWSDKDFAEKLQEASTWANQVSEALTKTMDALPPPLRYTLSDQVKEIQELTTALQVLSDIVLIVATDLSCIYVKNLVVELSTTVCVDLPRGMATEAWTFFVIAVTVSLTLSLSMNAFEQRVNEGYATTGNVEGVHLAETKKDLDVNVHANIHV